MAGVGGKVYDGLARLLRGERRAEVLEEVGDVDALPGGVCSGRGSGTAPAFSTKMRGR